jgi:hypothetical protein
MAHDMRLAVLLVAGLASFVVPSVAPAREKPQDPYPWCAVYGGSMNNSSNCGFTTRQQCLATVSGIGGSCEPNPFYKSRKRSNDRANHDQKAPPYYSPSGSWPSYFRN